MRGSDILTRNHSCKMKEPHAWTMSTRGLKIRPQSCAKTLCSIPSHNIPFCSILFHFASLFFWNGNFTGKCIDMVLEKRCIRATLIASIVKSYSYIFIFSISWQDRMQCLRLISSFRDRKNEWNWT